MLLLFKFLDFILFFYISVFWFFIHGVFWEENILRMFSLKLKIWLHYFKIKNRILYWSKQKIINFLESLIYEYYRFFQDNFFNSLLLWGVVWWMCLIYGNIWNWTFYWKLILLMFFSECISRKIERVSFYLFLCEISFLHLFFDTEYLTKKCAIKISVNTYLLRQLWTVRHQFEYWNI